ncbi:MAG: NAD-dependent epimerase/dehydratase family protein, partial [Planctomycetota bacterium]|nr:NAD-dependent epimerase/dehydratase family protein [Planctomycetota bacterium]
MSHALIGYTGFVGGTLNRQHRFEYGFNSKNIETLAGESFDLLICAGAPAEKWKANKEPEQDQANLARLTTALRRCRAERLVLISTVDVYPDPRDIDEDSKIDRSKLAPYGLNRLELEDFVALHFLKVHTLRLPALFGHGLKKNFIYDLFH